MFKVKSHCHQCRKATVSHTECDACREARNVAHALNVSAKWRG